jgi:hypothetical protein
MSFIPPELAKKIRLKKSRVVDLCDGELKVRIAGLLASVAFEMSGKDQKDMLSSNASLFIASCIDDKGNQLFKDAKEVQEFLNVVDVDDATRLLQEISSMSKALEKKSDSGNSEGTPSATP